MGFIILLISNRMRLDGSLGGEREAREAIIDLLGNMYSTCA